jgi:hypothetical protein
VSKLYISLLVTFFGLFATPADGQKQLVLLKREKVLLHLYPGDEIKFKLKGEDFVRTSYINNLFDTALVAHTDLVPFSSIEKIYFRTPAGLTKKIGQGLVVGGVGYFLIDQLNEVVVQGNKGSIDENVAITSAIMVGVGLPLILLKKKSQRIGGKYRLVTVQPGSMFYRRAPDRF